VRHEESGNVRVMLVNRGQQLGVLTFAEIATAVGELDLDEADVEELHGYLERAEIELVEELDPALAAADVERAPDKRGGRRKAKTALDLKPDMTTDSLQLFLKDIGKERLLTALAEVDLAKRIGRGDLDAKQKMVESNLRRVASIAKNYCNQGLPSFDPIQEGSLGLVPAAGTFAYRTSSNAPPKSSARSAALQNPQAAASLMNPTSGRTPTAGSTRH